jgi:hypothetical protein
VLCLLSRWRCRVGCAGWRALYEPTGEGSSCRAGEKHFSSSPSCADSAQSMPLSSKQHGSCRTWCLSQLHVVASVLLWRHCMYRWSCVTHMLHAKFWLIHVWHVHACAALLYMCIHVQHVHPCAACAAWTCKAFPFWRRLAFHIDPSRAWIVQADTVCWQEVAFAADALQEVRNTAACMQTSSSTAVRLQALHEVALCMDVPLLFLHVILLMPCRRCRMQLHACKLLPDAISSLSG